MWVRHSSIRYIPYVCYRARLPELAYGNMTPVVLCTDWFFSCFSRFVNAFREQLLQPTAEAIGAHVYCPILRFFSVELISMLKQLVDFFFE